MTLLVTGGSGQVAAALDTAAAARGMPVVRVGRPAFDLARPETIAAVMERVRPDAVVNAAAYTAVDAAETDAAAAYAANRDGPAVLAALCAARGVPLVHVSTDYVFDGAKGTPYAEDDATNPQGVYGASKLAGEQAVCAAYPDAVFVRTSWVYAPTGRNFLRTMLGAAERTRHLRVVADQRGCPTLADDLAAGLLTLLPVARGVTLHLAGSGDTTWHGFAEAIFRSAARYGVEPPEVAAIATADWPTPARRPADSRLDCSLAAARYGVRLPAWQGALDRAVDAVFAAAAPPELLP